MNIFLLSKESNLINWKFNNIISNVNINNKLLNSNKFPLLVNDLLNNKKDNLLNSSELNSNIKEGIIKENEINLKYK